MKPKGKSFVQMIREMKEMQGKLGMKIAILVGKNEG